MKNKIRVDVVLFVILSIIILYFFILNSSEQQYYKNILGQSYNGTAIVDLDIKIYPLFLGKTLSGDNIVPTGSNILVNVTVLNKGPSDFCQSLLIMRVCEPSMNCENNNDVQNYENATIIPLKVNEKYSVSFGRYRADKEGRWRYNFELQPLPPYCNISYSKKFKEFEAVSLNAYYQYKTNKDVETLTIIILFVSIITIAFSFDEVKKYTKKLIKRLTEGWFK